MIYAQADSSPYQAIVAVDGSGDYKTVQEAINAAFDVYDDKDATAEEIQTAYENLQTAIGFSPSNRTRCLA